MRLIHRTSFWRRGVDSSPDQQNHRLGVAAVALRPGDDVGTERRLCRIELALDEHSPMPVPAVTELLLLTNLQGIEFETVGQRDSAIEKRHVSIVAVDGERRHAVKPRLACSLFIPLSIEPVTSMKLQRSRQRVQQPVGSC